MTITAIHDRLSVSIVLYLFIMAIWGFFRAYRRQGMDGSFWGAIMVGEILILAQITLGIVLWLSSLRPDGGGMHILYALVTAITLPATYAFTHGRDTRREMIIYALTFLALIGLAGRVIVTGS
jgi:hypothetical protein